MIGFEWLRNPQNPSKRYFFGTITQLLCKQKPEKEILRFSIVAKLVNGQKKEEIEIELKIKNERDDYHDIIHPTNEWIGHIHFQDDEKYKQLLKQGPMVNFYNVFIDTSFQNSDSQSEIEDHSDLVLTKAIYQKPNGNILQNV